MELKSSGTHRDILRERRFEELKLKLHNDGKRLDEAEDHWNGLMEQKMYYKLSFDMDRLDESIKAGTNTIYAEAANMDEIEYENVRKVFLIISY